MKNYCCLKFDLWRLKNNKNCKKYWKAEKNVLVILASDFENPKEYNCPSDLKNSQYSLLQSHCLKAFPSADSLFRVHIKCSRRIWTSSFLYQPSGTWIQKCWKTSKLFDFYWHFISLSFFLTAFLPSENVRMAIELEL